MSVHRTLNVWSPYFIFHCYRLTSIRTLDLSNNKLQTLSDNISLLSNLKSLTCDNNKLKAASLQNIFKLSKLQTLSAGKNKLGEKTIIKPSTPPVFIPLPELPTSLKILKLNSNSFLSVPPSIYSGNNILIKLQKLDLSNNDLICIPEEIQNLVALTELNLDQNSIVAIGESVGKLSKLKVLSMRRNQIRVEQHTIFSSQNPQPIHSSVFTDTPLIDLNLDGNILSGTQLMNFDGFDAFLGKTYY